MFLSLINNINPYNYKLLFHNTGYQLLFHNTDTVDKKEVCLIMVRVVRKPDLLHVNNKGTD